MAAGPPAPLASARASHRRTPRPHSRNRFQPAPSCRWALIAYAHAHGPARNADRPVPATPTAGRRTTRPRPRQPATRIRSRTFGIRRLSGHRPYRIPRRRGRRPGERHHTRNRGRHRSAVTTRQARAMELAGLPDHAARATAVSDSPAGPLLERAHRGPLPHPDSHRPELHPRPPRDEPLRHPRRHRPTHRDHQSRADGPLGHRPSRPPRPREDPHRPCRKRDRVTERQDVH